jgi:hypothetical protein
MSLIAAVSVEAARLGQEKSAEKPWYAALSHWCVPLVSRPQFRSACWAPRTGPGAAGRLPSGRFDQDDSRARSALAACPKKMLGADPGRAEFVKAKSELIRIAEKQRDLIPLRR